MGAIDLVEGGWANMRQKRWALEKKARDDINREMEQYAESLADAVYRAVKIEKNSIAEVSRRMGASRPTVYDLVAKGEARSERGAAIGKLDVKHPYDAFLSRQGDLLVIDWPEWMNPDASDWDKRQRRWVPMDVSGTVVLDDGTWVSVVAEPEGFGPGVWDAWDSEQEKTLRHALSAQSFQNALNEWSGK